MLFLHRFLGLAGIYAQLQTERARNDRQDKTMSDITTAQTTADAKIEELAAKIGQIATGVSDLRATLQGLKDAAASPSDATTLSAAGAAALDGALAQVESLAATFAPASASALSA